MGRTLVASAAEFALTHPVFRPATRAGDHFAGFFEVQFDFAVRLPNLPSIIVGDGRASPLMKGVLI